MHVNIAEYLYVHKRCPYPLHTDESLHECFLKFHEIPFSSYLLENYLGNNRFHFRYFFNSKCSHLRLMRCKALSIDF